MIDIEKAKAVLADLEQQLKDANDRMILLTGAVQGAKVILESLESVPEEKEKEIKPAPKKR